MGKQRKLCHRCNEKHYPPTGNKCSRPLEDPTTDQEVGKSKQEKSGAIRKSKDYQSDINSSSRSMSLHGRSSVAQQPDCSVKRALAPGLEDQSNSEESFESTGEDSSQHVQLRILEELKKVNHRLDAVEDQVAERRQRRDSSRDTKLSTVKTKCKKKSKIVLSESSESSDDGEIPLLSSIRSSKAKQKQVDRSLADLEKVNSVKGNEQKLKSKRGGPVEVLVSHRVNWPHEYILGGSSKQRISYDQLNLCQFIHGFVKGVLDEDNPKYKEKMLSYLCDLMEDANDFTWANAKASHAVLLCEMERGGVTWSDTSRIDRIRRAHAQRHTVTARSNWGKGHDQSRKPWYCKPFQAGLCQFVKDHEVNGKWHKHICAHCLGQGKLLNHSEKDCYFVKRSQQSKNEQGAAQ